MYSTLKPDDPFNFSYNVLIDPFPKRHRLVRNDGFPKFEALYFSLNMVSLT